ncbi:MAG: family 43 glycosylhydrolase [Clostridia bacterium]|nr:family 43 glycosylhydrolase [Clostridia bacterium]
MVTSIRNGMPMTDTDGKVLHAHGAGFLEDNGFYYMFGEVREGDKRVACYRSRDLMTWEFRNVVLRLSSERKPYYVRTELDMDSKGRGANIERPKVIYCEKTKQYVMWMHYENGHDYNAACCAIATCDTPDGNYVYRGAFRPAGNMSRDCTIFKDKDGTAYFISTGRDNADMCVYRLSDDYMAIDEQVKALWPGQYREAPAVFERDGKYYMLSPMCTGWNPNQGGVSYANSIEGRWSAIENFGDAVTYNTQPTYVLKLGDNYIYVGDRWDPTDYDNSGYVFLPIFFDEDGKCSIEWQDEICFDMATKTYRTASAESNDVRIMTDEFTSYLASDGYDVFASRLSYKDERLIWNLLPKGNAFLLVNKRSGRALRNDGVMREVSGDTNMLWNIEEEDGGMRLVSCESGKALNARGRRIIISDKEDRFGRIRIVKAY